MGMPEVVVDGEVIEADPPRKLVHTWRFLYSDEVKAEGPTRVTFEISEGEAGVCRLTVTHELENAPETAEMLAGDAGGRRRRLGLRAQRPQDAARDRRVVAGLDSGWWWRRRRTAAGWGGGDAVGAASHPAPVTAPAL